MRLFFVRIALAAICIIFCSCTSRASDKQGQDTPSTHAQESTSLDVVQRVELQGHVLNVPRGYFLNQEQGEFLTFYPRIETLTVGIEMPSRRFVANNRPHGQRSEGGSTYEFGAMLEFRKREDLAKAIYWYSIHERTKAKFENAHEIDSNAFGLEHAWFSRKDGKVFHIYRNVPSKNLGLNVFCFPLSKPSESFRCFGAAYAVPQELTIFFIFEFEQLVYWHDMVIAVCDLVRSWKETPSPQK